MSYFPESYEFRPQQQKIIKDIDYCLKNDLLSLIEAPPGTGKTIAAIVSSLPYANNSLDGRIYWLGSYQNIYQNLTEDILMINKEKQGNILLSLFISKQKMCLHEIAKKSDFYLQCNQLRNDLKCPFYEQTYNRDIKGKITSLNPSAKELILQLDANFRKGRYRLKRKTIWSLIVKSKCTRAYCPYEIMKHLVPQCEVFAGDYNYVFRESIKRTMDETLDLFNAKRRILIIDEADKFYERMLSQLTMKLTSTKIFRIVDRLKAEIVRMRKDHDPNVDQYTDFLEFIESFDLMLSSFVKKVLKVEAGEEKSVYKRSFIQFIEEYPFESKNAHSYIYYCKRLTEIIEELFPGEQWDSQINEFMYSWLKVDSYNFLRRAFVDETNQNYSLEIHPLNLHRVPIYFNGPDPVYLHDILKTFTDIIFISATLYPDIFSMRMGLINWEKHICNVTSYHIPEENYLFIIPSFLTSEYKKRKEMLPQYAALLNDLVNSTKKKILVFGTSKETTDRIYHHFNPNPKFFKNKHSDNVHWSWIRSSQSRGIDLRDFSICVIAGLPYPPVNDLLSRARFANLKKEFHSNAWRIFQSDIIKETIQAFCRLLRQPSDRAIIILGDYRFNRKGYKDLLPAYYQKRMIVCQTEQELLQICETFFQQERSQISLEITQ